MANQNQNGRNVALPDENRPSWSPHDQQPRSRSERERERDDRERDEDRYERDRSRGGWGGMRESRMSSHRDDDRDEGYRPAERYGQGQSGYTSGRWSDDRSTSFQGRNQGYGSPGSFEDRQTGLGTDDRWGAARGQSYWQDRSDRDRGYGSERQSGYGARGWEDQQAPRYAAADQRYDDRPGWGGSQSVGYQTGYGGSTQSTGYQGARPAGMSTPSQNYYGQQGGRSFEPRPSYRGRGPQGYQRSDERIRELVCEVLTDDDYVDATMIEVAVTGGEVVLSGSVSDRNAKRHAEDIVERVPGVKDVQNQIKVHSDKSQQGKGPASGEPRTDGGRSTSPTSSSSSSSSRNEAESEKKHRA